tara:strand:+ start:2483 stop:3301 length:819 start_codon:yes stop_codon:yes gene_type:complete
MDDDTVYKAAALRKLKSGPFICEVDELVEWVIADTEAMTTASRVRDLKDNPKEINVMRSNGKINVAHPARMQVLNAVLRAFEHESVHCNQPGCERITPDLEFKKIYKAYYLMQGALSVGMQEWRAKRQPKWKDTSAEMEAIRRKRMVIGVQLFAPTALIIYSPPVVQPSKDEEYDEDNEEDDTEEDYLVGDCDDDDAAVTKKRKILPALSMAAQPGDLTSIEMRVFGDSYKNMDGMARIKKLEEEFELPKLKNMTMKQRVLEIEKAESQMLG